MINYFEKAKGTIKNYNKGEIIKNEGDTCENIFYIISGEIKAYTYSYLENQFLINTIYEKNIFGDIPLFSTNNKYLGNIIASKKSTIKIISKNEFLNMCEDKSFLSLYLRYIDDKFLLLQNRLKVLSQKSIREKILFMISKKQNKILNFDTKEKLAEYLNIPRPSLSRELILLKDEGIIDYNRHSIILKKY